MSTTNLCTRIDLRAVVQPERQPLILNAFVSLGLHESLEFIDDLDACSLEKRLRLELPGNFLWQDLQGPPGTSLVRLTKTSEGHGNGRCCGACGGA